MLNFKHLNSFFWRIVKQTTLIFLSLDAAHTFDYMLSGKSEKKSTKVRSRMEGAGNFFKIVTPQLDCYGFCVWTNNVGVSISIYLLDTAAAKLRNIKYIQ